jgi:hypothetical protein
VLLVPARIEREEEPMAAPATREVPRQALYRGHEHVLVLGYEGDGRFTVERDGATTSIHRDHLKFLRAPMKVVAALDEAVEALQAPVGSAVAPRRSK